MLAMVMMCQVLCFTYISTPRNSSGGGGYSHYLCFADEKTKVKGSRQNDPKGIGVLILETSEYVILYNKREFSNALNDLQMERVSGFIQVGLM